MAMPCPDSDVSTGASDIEESSLSDSSSVVEDVPASKSARGKEPTRSILKGGYAAGICHDSSGNRLSSDGDKRSITWSQDGISSVVEFVHELPLGAQSVMRKLYSDGDAVKRAHLARCRLVHEKEWAERIARSLCKARCLSLAHGYETEYEWPVAWYDGKCEVFAPPADGVIDDDYLVSKHAHEATTVRVSRDEGIALLRNVWCNYYHVGDIPCHDMIERTCSTSPPAGAALPNFDVACIHAHGEPPITPIVKAMPVVRETVGEPIGVDSWLMDTGTPLDIVDRSYLGSNLQFVKPCRPVVLDTANGELPADVDIDLWMGRLGERIAPYVLESSPNVLSLGRRVVCDGYDWYWKGYSKRPFLVHPKTRERIYMRVEDYCPYLDDNGTTTPMKLFDMSSTACAVPRRATAPAPMAQSHAVGSTDNSDVTLPGGVDSKAKDSIAVVSTDSDPGGVSNDDSSSSSSSSSSSTAMASQNSNAAADDTSPVVSTVKHDSVACDGMASVAGSAVKDPAAVES